MASSTQRFGSIDALRGVAIVWMTVFHFCFDLNHFGYLRQNFYHDPFWTWQRTCIVSLFLFCAGFGQAIAVHQGQSWRRFWRRWAQVAGCALLVTAGSALMFPQSYIYFGVLHGIAVMLLIVRLTAGWGRWLWLAGALAIAMKFIAEQLLATGTLSSFAEMFNARPLNWLGLITKKPITEDYVPVLPWLGVMWWGMAAGRWVLEQRPQWLARVPGGAAGRPLALLGRWSLSWYMLHQPVLIGLLTALAALK
ncbi:DUF1624 domain-containing protein [Variovorax terrae]|uniref:DUF1624 domain-containing protein n=1 Tax=Variovorax terrae TaxID=2923278 RepID=A0A9X1VZB5_9BURK|nr:heparan-alpha-glucosaminide N-acetyltransferase [Variovorax terrae]MCJ0763253.1 DUF1624 domain-containing protein [Variovorax terrae]